MKLATSPCEIAERGSSLLTRVFGSLALERVAMVYAVNPGSIN